MADSVELVELKSQVSKTVDQLIAEMAALEVDSDEKYKACEEWLRRNKDTQKLVAEAFEADRVEKKAAYDAVLDAKAKLIKPLETADKTVRSRMVAWSTAREKARREEEERARAALQAERSEDVLLEAETLEAMGRSDKADELLERGARVTKAEVVRSVTTEKVGRTMEKWEVRVTNKAAFLKALVATGQYVGLLACVEVSEPKLAAYARQNKGLEFAGLEVRQTFVPVI